MADREMTLAAHGPRLQELARRLGVAGFWRWWTAQLGACVPAEPRTALIRRRTRPVLLFDSTQATLWQPSRKGPLQMTRTATIPLSGDTAAVVAAGRSAIGTLTGMVYGGAASPNRLLVALPPRDVLRKRVVLPAAAEENYRQALAYDLDRHTPFKAEELYFDAAIVDRDAAKGTISVDLAAARRTLIDPALRHAATWGAEVIAVVPDAPGEASSSRLNLLPEDARVDASVWTRWQFWLPVCLLGVLALAVVVVPLWQKREYAIALGTLADEARARAAVSETLRLELDTQVADYNAALERKYAYPGALQVVDAVSKIMPDDTWLMQFELKSVAKGKEMQRELLMRGESANAGRLVQLFEESALFAQAAPRSQTTKIQPGPGEIFDLGAQLKPLPKTAPLVTQVGDLPEAGTSVPGATPPAPAKAGTAATTSPGVGNEIPAAAGASMAAPAGAAPDARAVTPPASSAPATAPTPPATPAAKPATTPAGKP